MTVPLCLSRVPCWNRAVFVCHSLAGTPRLYESPSLTTRSCACHAAQQGTDAMWSGCAVCGSVVIGPGLTVRVWSDGYVTVRVRSGGYVTVRVWSDGYVTVRVRSGGRVAVLIR